MGPGVGSWEIPSSHLNLVCHSFVSGTPGQNPSPTHVFLHALPDVWHAFAPKLFQYHVLPFCVFIVGPYRMFFAVTLAKPKYMCLARNRTNALQRP